MTPHSPIESEIDRLYQLPLSEFIAARNDLAKRAGADAARIKALEKPNAAAWAVNQLFSRDRRLYDAVVKMSTRARTAHGHALTGKKTDVPLAEAAHAAAVRDAVDRAAAILRSAGDPATEATLAAVKETLRALPVDETTSRPGRLTRPIQAAVGFGGLGDLLRGAAIRPSAQADVVRFSSRESKKHPREADREAERAKFEAAAAERERAAKRRAAESALEAASKSLADLDEDRRDLDARVQRSNAALTRVRAEIDRLERELRGL
jgi:hypothetical protein